MFQVNDYIICGGNGVCRVINIGTPDMSMGDEKRDYYKLQSIYENGSTIYIPVDNDKIVMRKVIAKEEAIELINSIPSIEIISVDDDKVCEAKYKEAMYKYECKEWIKIIKTSYLRREGRLADGKKSTSTDDKYLKMAEEYLFGELAISLNMPKENVEDFIAQQIKNINDLEA